MIVSFVGGRREILKDPLLHTTHFLTTAAARFTIYSWTLPYSYTLYTSYFVRLMFADESGLVLSRSDSTDLQMLAVKYGTTRHRPKGHQEDAHKSM